MARDPALRRCADLPKPLSPNESQPGPVAVEALTATAIYTGPLR